MRPKSTTFLSEFIEPQDTGHAMEAQNTCGPKKVLPLQLNMLNMSKAK
jgi:hypothetical protein